MTFSHVADKVSRASGKAAVFLFAVMLVAMWFASGFFLGFTDTWQLLINTPTTIITFLMVFILQHTQNKDNKAIHAKLDDLLEQIAPDSKELVGVEDEEDDRVEEVQEQVRERA